MQRLDLKVFFKKTFILNLFNAISLAEPSTSCTSIKNKLLEKGKKRKERQ